MAFFLGRGRIVIRHFRLTTDVPDRDPAYILRHRQPSLCSYCILS